MRMTLEQYDTSNYSKEHYLLATRITKVFGKFEDDVQLSGNEQTNNQTTSFMPRQGTGGHPNERNNKFIFQAVSQKHFHHCHNGRHFVRSQFFKRGLNLDEIRRRDSYDLSEENL